MIIIALAAAALAGSHPAAQPAAAAPRPVCTAAQAEAAPPRKSGFGLGKLLGAAKRAGVTDMLTGRFGGGLLARGGGGKIAGAIAGTALEAAAGAEAQASSARGEAVQPVAPCGGTR
jgi:hypothetical protein